MDVDDHLWVTLMPRLRPGGTAARLYSEVARLLATKETPNRTLDVHQLRDELLEVASKGGDQTQFARACISVLFDLWAQGWTFAIRDDSVVAKPPDSTTVSPELEKARLRAAHSHARDAQLSKTSVRQFIRTMERRHLGPHGWTSIFSLMRDGRDFASTLRTAATQPAGERRQLALKRTVDPYIQFVDADSICQFTGFRLIDIWRYFRYTWSTPHNSTPGRRMLLLIRDRSTDNHPIIGIAALASAVVQHGHRDTWIGWTGERFLSDLTKAPSARWARWLDRTLNHLLDSIYCNDFLAEGLLTRSEIRRPIDNTTNRLLKEAKVAWRQHRLYPKATQHKSTIRSADKLWEERAKTQLFRAKRAETLARLLRVRGALAKAGYTAPTKACLSRALRTSPGRWAVTQIIRAVKSSHVGIDMLDITVCGAIPPYSHVIGGKLISLLVASPEVIQTYERRYGRAESVIASSMAGRAVRRRPKLVLLGTTSLYGVGSSQYNRLKVPAERLGGKRETFLWFEPIGRSVGYGSFHLSSDTVAEIEALLSQTRGGRRVNSIFGEGVSPRFRKLREGLELVGFPADRLLQHGSPRLVYAIPLALNFRQILLGTTRQAQYILPQIKPQHTTALIVAFWMERWLSNRIEKEDVLKDIERHSLVHPIEHGARVNLPSTQEDLPLFPTG